jgi:glycosyltransferase involved in cell wall biosynthesis
MRVLLCHQPTDGGVGRHVRDIAEGLHDEGLEVILCSPAVPEGTSPALAHVPLDLRRAIAPRPDLAAQLRLARIIARLRPDIVHAHSSKAGALARLARLSRPRLRVLYTPHGFAFAGYFSRSLERSAYRLIERALAPLASRVVCVCEAEARLARSVGAAGRVRVVYNGVAPAGEGATDPRLLDLQARGPIIGALTMLRPGKGLETLIAATPLILARHPDAQVAIMGEGPDLQELSALARRLGVHGAVHLLGTSGDPLAALRGFEVFVHPSWAESFPYVILEALSLGRPIVASDVGGVGEALVDGESGVLVPPRDERALAAALLALLDDPARRAALGRQALQRSRRFTRAAMVQQLAGIYAELAADDAPMRLSG